MIGRPMIAMARDGLSGGEYALTAAGRKQAFVVARRVRIGHTRGKLEPGLGDGFAEPGCNPSAIASRTAPHDPGGVARLVNRIDHGRAHITRQPRLSVDGGAQRDVIEKRIQSVRPARSTVSQRGGNGFQGREQMGDALRMRGGRRRLCGGSFWLGSFGRDHGIDPSRRHVEP